MQSKDPKAPDKQGSFGGGNYRGSGKKHQGESGGYVGGKDGAAGKATEAQISTESPASGEGDNGEGSVAGAVKKDR